MVNRADKTPLYYQLYQILRQQIQNGDWQEEEMLPTELDLVNQYTLSRSTVRQALDMLVDDGLIYRRQGQGSFVSQPTIEQKLSGIVSFTEDMEQRGMVPGTQLVSASLMTATEDIASVLTSVQVGDEIANIVRLRLADDEPMSVEYSYLVHEYCPGVLKSDYTKTSLRQTLAKDYGIHLTSAQQKIRAVSATPNLARMLNVDENAALLYIERISYSDRNIPIELLRIHLRGCRYTLYSELRG